MVSDSVSKPKVDSIEGLPVDQRGSAHNEPEPEIHHRNGDGYLHALRILFAKLGERSCPSCGDKVIPSVDGEAYHGPSDEEEISDSTRRFIVGDAVMVSIN